MKAKNKFVTTKSIFFNNVYNCTLKLRKVFFNKSQFSKTNKTNIKLKNIKFNKMKRVEKIKTNKNENNYFIRII